MICIDPRRTRTAEQCDEHVAIRPGSDALLAAGMAQVMIAEGLAEVCDGLDNDCDEIIDEDGRVGHYPDNDGDGYGADLPPELYCEDDAPDDYVTTPYDCNDEDETVNPDGTEVCGDGEDNDCDGGVDNLPECD